MNRTYVTWGMFGFALLWQCLFGGAAQFFSIRPDLLGAMIVASVWFCPWDVGLWMAVTGGLVMDVALGSPFFLYTVQFLLLWSGTLGLSRLGSGRLWHMAPACIAAMLFCQVLTLLYVYLQGVTLSVFLFAHAAASSVFNGALAVLLGLVGRRIRGQ